MDEQLRVLLDEGINPDWDGTLLCVQPPNNQVKPDFHIVDRVTFEWLVAKDGK